MADLDHYRHIPGSPDGLCRGGSLMDQLRGFLLSHQKIESQKHLGKGDYPFCLSARLENGFVHRRVHGAGLRKLKAREK